MYILINIYHSYNLSSYFLHFILIVFRVHINHNPSFHIQSDAATY